MLARTPLVPLSAAIIVTVFALSTTPAFASKWTVSLMTASRGEAHAEAPPSAPAGASAVCYSPTQQKVTVSWSAVAHASSYTIFKSTTSATTGFSTTASGVSTTSWTSATLTVGNYWFEVAAYVGTSWVSANSTATGESTISSSRCVQP
jgi:hypothetical protein